MAKKSLIQREKKRQKLEKKYHLIRGSLKKKDKNAEFGFQRPEVGKEKLAGTVGFHERHVFLCYKGPEEWPSHLEAAESERLPRLLAAAIKARKPNLKKTVSTRLFSA